MTDIVVSTRPHRRRVIINKKLAPYIFLLPFLLLFAVFLIIPLIYAFDLSVYRSALVGGVHVSSGSTTTSAPLPTPISGAAS